MHESSCRIRPTDSGTTIDFSEESKSMSPNPVPKVRQSFRDMRESIRSMLEDTISTRQRTLSISSRSDKSFKTRSSDATGISCELKNITEEEEVPPWRIGEVLRRVSMA